MRFLRMLLAGLLDLTAKAKLATADAGKGLGSGENDYTALADRNDMEKLRAGGRAM